MSVLEAKKRTMRKKTIIKKIYTLTHRYTFVIITIKKMVPRQSSDNRGLLLNK